MNELITLLSGIAQVSVASKDIATVIPTAIEIASSLNELLGVKHHHSALDVAQDALDACENNELSHETTLQIVALALTDHQRRSQKQA